MQLQSCLDSLHKAASRNGTQQRGERSRCTRSKNRGEGRLQKAYQEKHPSPPMRRYSTGLVMRGGSSTLRSAMWGPPAGLAAAEADSSAATTATATAAATAAAAAGGDPIAAGSFSHSPLCGTWPLNPSWDLGRGLGFLQPFPLSNSPQTYYLLYFTISLQKIPPL